jgi:hypothetical protein
MRTRVIVPAILSAVMLSAPVFAANNISSPGKATNPVYKTVAMTAAEKCTKLEQQFDDAIKTHGKAAKANEAKNMRTEGGNLCAGGKQADGVTKLQQAIKALGVKPKA